MPLTPCRCPLPREDAGADDSAHGWPSRRPKRDRETAVTAAAVPPQQPNVEAEPAKMDGKINVLRRDAESVASLVAAYIQTNEATVREANALTDSIPARVVATIVTSLAAIAGAIYTFMQAGPR